MDADALQHAINELIQLDFRPPNTAAWVKAVEAAPVNVVAGAIVMWLPPGLGISMTSGDQNAPRREAAMAILQARFATDQAQFARQSSRQTRWVIGLTWAIAALTAVMLVAVAAPLLTPVPTHTELMSLPTPK